MFITLSPLILGLLAPAQQEEPARPDVLVVLLSDISHVDFSPDIPTRRLDKFSKRGRKLDRFYSFPIGQQTMYTLMFGAYPRREGILQGTSYYHDSPELPDPSTDQMSLPKLLGGLGYQTALFGKWGLGDHDLVPVEGQEISRAETPGLHGFDVWRAVVPHTIEGKGGTSYRDWLRVDDGVETQETKHATVAMRDEFISWWSETPGPRFAVVYFYAAHGPFEAPPSKLLPKNYAVGPNLRDKRGLYEGMVVSVDTVFGEILSVVSRDTWVFLLADNGTPNSIVREKRTAKRTTMEEGTRVPAAVRGPGVEPGESSALVSSVDVYATIAEIAGAASYAPDSISFFEVLRDPEARTREHVFVEFGTSTKRRDVAVRDERYKLRFYRGEEMLFDLKSDPREKRPLDLTLEENQRIADKLRPLLTDP